ncbi:phosphopantothenoylcysteine decarboxylase/phosphopantothenate/cysteine ligase [Solidesulfovibrio carbinoliphilus subsp. oakridgensis]|uniref:Coenzyme A biosynthesis bifunctional protein CoaBC n=1 Tax=Solidesulfovibrio carbinoliphilus subsp. oakridgensis TaxID=694327 RepID=G7Q5B3_9BACT|nr:bifunctional phosphopantothenoylcysteine decarboxylase/phosphopantothenate--cysteine ligase CoaBC [Solidesulfovibrio carbinoliphilus]EHJ48436.1 phosphopantothenoylcysteine decarboxylase/phosphopantothenate/cysteine ligase [Solidesulfovibrio carbinoliphilus subsp. oakridgensis]
MQTTHIDFSGYMGRRVHLGVTGSVAAFKALPLLRRLLATGASVGVTLTEAAGRFVTPLSFEALGADPVYTDMFSPEAAQFAHLAPAQAADVLAVVPATADVMARLAHGLAGDLLACQALAFEGPLVVAPAMNPRLWRAAATKANWQTLLSRGVIGVAPDCGEMACGESGQGRLAPEEAIFAAILKALTPQDLAGKRVLVGLGPTREYFDAARFWSNPSTGRMGASLALAAWLRGAAVTVVTGPVSWWYPEDVAVVPVTSAAQMYEACLEAWTGGCDIGVMAAAVADFSPIPHPGGGKFKKNEAKDGSPVVFTATRDILAAMGAKKTPGQYLVGFSAETDNLLENARGKLVRKRCDLMIANPIGRADAGFASPGNEALALAADGRQESWGNIPKTEMAWKIWDFTIRS